MLSVYLLNNGLNVLLLGLEKALMPTARNNELRWQQQVHEKVPGIAVLIDNSGQYTDDEDNFKPNKEQAEERARHRIQFGVGQRLKGAIALYGVQEQMECVRHIILALDTVFCTLNWQEASAWCNEQNRVLYELHQKKQKAA